MPQDVIIVDATGREHVFPAGFNPVQAGAIVRAQTAPPAESGLWASTKHAAKSAMELAGRPGEFVSGLVAGTLQGGLGEGLRRGSAAAFESNLADSKIQEGVGKILEEQNILADSPRLRALVGFAGDAVTDPLNLLGGAGLIRRGLLTGAKAAGVAPDIARAAVGVPIGEAFQRGVTTAARGLETAAAAQFPKLLPGAELRALRDAKTGLSAYDMQRLAEGQARAAREIAVHDVKDAPGAVFKGVTKEEGQLLARARAYPDSAEAAQVAADPRLTKISEAAGAEFDALYQTDVEGRFIDATKPLKLGSKVQARLDAMTPKQRQRVLAIAQAGEPRALKPGEVMTPERKVAKALWSKTTRTEDGMVLDLADRNTLHFAVDPKTGTVTTTVSTKIPNYVGHYTPGETRPASVFRALRPEMREAKERVTTFNEAVAKGAPSDLAEILIRRKQSSARAAIDKQLITDWTTAFGAKTPSAGMSKLQDTTLARLPDDLRATLTETPYLPAAVTQEIEKFTARVSDPEAMEGILRRSLKLFKTSATSLNLGTFQMTNFLGNVVNMYGSGMSMDQIARNYAKAGQVIAGKGRFADFTDDAGTLWTHDAIMDAAKKNGIYGHVSGYAGELGQQAKLTPTAKALTGQRWNPLNADNPLYKRITDTGQKFVEDPAKLGMFVHELRTGQGVAKSTLRVKDTLFDYAELTDFERKIRANAIPFYTFTRKNLPLQVEHLVRNPKSAANQGRLLGLLNEVAAADEGAPVNPAQLPDYLQEGNAFQIPVLRSERGDPVAGTFRTPLMDLNLLGTDLPATSRRLTGMLNPLIKAPIELLRNERLDRKGPLTEGYSKASLPARALGLGAVKPDGTRVQPNLQKYLMEQLPIPGRALLASATDEATPKTGMPFGWELLARASGLSPTVQTAAMKKAARTAAKAEKTRAKTAAKQDREYARWQARDK